MVTQATDMATMVTDIMDMATTTQLQVLLELSSV
eukprot:CAMPEP_0116877758 /NCGR_PEP_ID=MMETSP0463-20121206/9502_1 /TAXON_ID=181622 /ORGANISM="Strombidinopsis sp, Strain SopsisLIS2011" /LENGTH=33 /DNA_ID= /DNA_START= /DNA_END= /DNA_ORIENTATION=